MWPEEELALGVSSTLARRETTARSLIDLARRSQADRLLAVLGRQRLIHLGIARLGEVGADELAAPLAERLEPRLRAVRWQGVEQEMLAHSLIGTLAEHRIKAVPVKGAVLGRRLFDDPGLHEAGDIDLLLSATQLEPAAGLLREHFGYDAPHDPRREDGRPLLHYRLSHPDGLPLVELHWRLHWYEDRSGLAMVRRAISEQGLVRLAPVDELACLLLVYARDGFAGIRPLAHLAAWWDRYGDQLPREGLAGFGEEFPELGPALWAAAWLADALAGVPAARLGLTSYASSWRARRALRLANWQLGGVDEQIFADIALVDLLLAPRPEAWASIRRQVLLPLDVAASRLLDPRSPHTRLVLATALHVPRTLGRFALAMLATAGRRTRSALP